MLKIAHHADGTQRKIHLGGWKKQEVDERDNAYRLKLPTGFSAAPPVSDLRSIMSPVEDQGELGSCTANMFAGLIEANENRRTSSAHRGAVVHTATAPSVAVSGVTVSAAGVISFTTTVTPGSQPAPTPTPTPAPTPSPTPTPTHKLVQVSRLFEYYATRKIEGTTSEDSGASIRDAIKAGVKYGVANEAAYPYDISKFANNPPQNIWTDAAAHKVTSYHSITDGDIDTMKSAIASGYPIGFGFEVYSYFMGAQMAKLGVLHVPTSSETYEGGHAVCLVGYDDSKKLFLVRNSWGTNWGVAGYFWMPYDYVGNTKLSNDFWVVQSSPV